jgi:RHS repeat-associated protein
VLRTTPLGARAISGDPSLPKRHIYEGDKLVEVNVLQPNQDAIYPDVTYYSYDASGNQTRDWSERHRYSPSNGHGLLSVKMGWNYYGADQQLRFAQRYDGTFDPDDQWAQPKRRGTFEEYRYDPLGRRIMVRSQRDTTNLCDQPGCSNFTDIFVWSGAQLIQETHRGMPRRYVQGAGIDRPLKIGEIIPHADYNGVYDGGTHAATGAAFTGADYPGRNRGAFMEEGARRIENLYASLLQGQSDATGLAYRRNRYYDPETGRFTQEDPIGLAGGLNLYGYAGGDPVNFADPFGLDCLDRQGNRVPCMAALTIANMLATGFLGKLAPGETELGLGTSDVGSTRDIAGSIVTTVSPTGFAGKMTDHGTMAIEFKGGLHVSPKGAAPVLLTEGSVDLGTGNFEMKGRWRIFSVEASGNLQTGMITETAKFLGITVGTRTREMWPEK